MLPEQPFAELINIALILTAFMLASETVPMDTGHLDADVSVS